MRVLVSDPCPAPIRLGSARPHIVVGDVHGMAVLFEALLTRMQQAAPDADITLLGDLINRGPDSLGVLAHAFSLIEHAGAKTVTVLPGNHEQLLLGTLADLPGYTQAFGARGGAWALPWMGSAAPGLSKTQALEQALHAKMGGNGPVRARMALLNHAPMYHQVGNVLMVHAGIAPDVGEPAGWAQQHVLLPKDPKSCQPLWIRAGFHQSPRPPGLVVVHGHTPEAKIARLDTRISAPYGVFTLDHGRLGLDAGSARTKMVAGALLTEGAYQVFVARA